MSSVHLSIQGNDRAANLVLQELHQVIADHIDVDYIVPHLYKKRYLSLKKVQYLQNPQRNLTDQDKKDYLLYNVLMNGGGTALTTLLDALDETSQQHQPHENLAFKLRKHYHDVCDQINQGLAEEPHAQNANTPSARPSVTTDTPPSVNTQSLPQVPDIIPQIFSQITQNLGNSTPPVTKNCDRLRNSTPGPACNYFIAVSGVLNPSHCSTSLNDDAHDDLRLSKPLHSASHVS